MAHEITSKDVFGEVRANGEKAWHGLGVEMPEGKTCKEGFTDIGLGWGTRLVPVTIHSPVAGSTKMITDPDFMMHIREDTEESLGIVGTTYKPISNTSLAEFMDALVGADATMKLETAGSLRGGKRVFCTCKLPKTIEVVNNDILDLYVIGSNSHDGSAALQIYGSSIRVVCANTLAWSERESSGRSMFKFEHSGDVALKLEQAQATLGILVKKSAVFEREAKNLAKQKLSTAQAKGYFEACYDFTFGAIKADWSEKEQARRQEHKTKQVEHWMELLEHETNVLKGMKGSAWAAYNAFSLWSDHERGRFKETKESEARVHSNLFGISHTDKKKAFHKAVSLSV